MSRKSFFRSFLADTNVDFMKYHKLVITLSISLLLLSVILVFARGLNFGIDFKGGIAIEISLPEKVDLPQLRKSLSEGNVGEFNIQNFDEKTIMIRISKDSSENHTATINKIQNILGKQFSSIEYRKIDFVGPQIGQELIQKGFLALLFSCLSIMIYIWIRFDWQFGVGAIMALAHDTLIVMGFFSISGLEFNTTSIAAILTIIGYSINDSVVIYDKIRENLIKLKSKTLTEIINSSINSTLSRTVLTAGTTLTSLLALILFGGDVLKSFSVSVFFGIIVGTLSSIYISAPILLYMNPEIKKKQ